MTSAHMNKNNWTELFREAGVDDATMHRWHVAFERRWPSEHQGFLEWLSLPAVEIERIRNGSRAGTQTP
jgi:hypothetical protein